jgi:hypothetical protein
MNTPKLPVIISNSVIPNSETTLTRTPVHIVYDEPKQDCGDQINFVNYLYSNFGNKYDSSTLEAFQSALHTCRGEGKQIISSEDDTPAKVKKIDAIFRKLIRFGSGKTLEDNKSIIRVMDYLLKARQRVTGSVEGNDGRAASIQKYVDKWSIGTRNNTHSRHIGGRRRRRRTQKRKN